MEALFELLKENRSESYELVLPAKLFDELLGSSASHSYRGSWTFVRDRPTSFITMEVSPEILEFINTVADVIIEEGETFYRINRLYYKIKLHESTLY